MRCVSRLFQNIHVQKRWLAHKKVEKSQHPRPLYAGITRHGVSSIHRLLHFLSSISVSSGSVLRGQRERDIDMALKSLAVLLVILLSVPPLDSTPAPAALDEKKFFFFYFFPPGEPCAANN